MARRPEPRRRQPRGRRARRQVDGRCCARDRRRRCRVVRRCGRTGRGIATSRWSVSPSRISRPASKRVDATINDLFLAGMVEGAVRYHADRDVEVDAFNTSFVLSTRTDEAIGGNSFTPVPVQVPGAPMPLADRVADISERLAAKARGDDGRWRSRCTVGRGQPAADLGRHPSRPCSGLARSTSPRRTCAGRGSRCTCRVLKCSTFVDGPGRRHGLQRDRDVVQRHLQHRLVHRSGGDRRAR